MKKQGQITKKTGLRSFIPNFHDIGFICLSHSRIFHSYGDVTIAGEMLQILTYARHLRPLRMYAIDGNMNSRSNRYVCKDTESTAAKSSVQYM